ncbi:MAG: hypothetical protein EXR71_08560 [Myxococcales bacterium]|nr:hypothetical protein [Myxococcales bacterium]
MRVTRNGLWELVRANLRATNVRTRVVEEQAVTGLRFNRPSDAPQLVGQIDRLHATRLDQGVFESNSSQALAQLDQLDSTLGQIHDALTRARELAVQSASELSNGDQRGYSAGEVGSIRGSVLAAANVDFAGRYLFAGTNWDSPPFDATGAYGGSTDVPSVRVGDVSWVQTGRDGSAVFSGAVDVFGVLDALKSALEADDTVGIQAALDGLDGALDQVMAARADVGIDARMAEDAGALADGLSSEIESRMDSLLGADPAETYTRLSELRQAYETALQVASSSKGQSLFDLI